MRNDNIWFLLTIIVIVNSHIYIAHIAPLQLRLIRDAHRHCSDPLSDAINIDRCTDGVPQGPVLFLITIFTSLISSLTNHSGVQLHPPPVTDGDIIVCCRRWSHYRCHLIHESEHDALLYYVNCGREPVSWASGMCVVQSLVTLLVTWASFCIGPTDDIPILNDI